MTRVRSETATPRLADAVAAAQRLARASGGEAFAVAVERAEVGPDPLAPFRDTAGGVRMAFYQPDRRRALVGLGLVAAWRARGPNTLAAAGERHRRLAPAAVVGDGPRWRLPLAFAGFAFAPEPRARHWAPFGDGLLLVPRVALLLDGDEAWRVETVLVRADGSHTSGTLPPPEAGDAKPDRAVSPAEWTAAVLRVLDRIAAGEAAKVVVAREARLERHRPPEEVLLTLALRFPSCTVFAFDLGGPCFLGATPERLAAVERGAFEVMALAGTAPRGGTPAEDEALAARLLADRKEREEHAVVVRAILGDLGPVAGALRADAEPHVVRLPNLHHLRTLVRGQLRAGVTLFDLAARLHPTPAVGGMPRGAARRLIAEVEPFDRGWYAGPLGWVDAAGDGEFVVALRSALLVPGEPARVFAGCGIVARSDPEREFAESELKLAAIREALAGEAAP